MYKIIQTVGATCRRLTRRGRGVLFSESTITKEEGNHNVEAKSGSCRSNLVVGGVVGIIWAAIELTISFWLDRADFANNKYLLVRNLGFNLESAIIVSFIIVAMMTISIVSFCLVDKLELFIRASDDQSETDDKPVESILTRLTNALLLLASMGFVWINIVVMINLLLFGPALLLGQFVEMIVVDLNINYVWTAILWAGWFVLGFLSILRYKIKSKSPTVNACCQ